MTPQNSPEHTPGNNAEDTPKNARESPPGSTTEFPPGNTPESLPENTAESPPPRGRKFYIALASYAAIALLASFTLDGNFRLVVWVFMGYLAFRTYLHTLRKP